MGSQQLIGNGRGRARQSRSRNGAGAEGCPCPGCKAGSGCIVRIEGTESVLAAEPEPPVPPRTLMALGIDLISSRVAARGVGWYPINARGEDTHGCLVSVSQVPAHALEQARLEYILRYHRDDPFAPRRFITSSAPLVSTSDIGGREALLATSYGAELLAAHGIEYEAVLYIRDGERMLGAVRVGRGGEDGDFGRHELEFLRCAQRLLEATYTSALNPAPRPSVDDLRTQGLTRREAEVARLAAGGARNPEIAARLSIGEATVKTHLLAVFKKLDVRNRAELASRLRPIGA